MDEEKENIGGAGLIARERQRQKEGEGFTAQHDDQHARGELLDAAVCYAAVASQTFGDDKDVAHATRAIAEVWPWSFEWWKPSQDPVRNLVKAGALIAAEIDRLQRSRT